MIQFIKYFFVGGLAAVIDWLIYWMLIEYFSLFYLQAAFISFIIATLVNYLLSIKWVFKNRRYKKTMEVVLIYIISAVGLIINELFLYVLVELIEMNLLSAKISATGVVFFWNYFARKIFVFK